jgi:hypothetical protein
MSPKVAFSFTHHALLCIVFSLAVAAAPDAHAGLIYRFESVTEGASSSTVSGAVKVDRNNVRMDVESGDGVLLPSGSVVVSRDAGRTLRIADLEDRTYYDIRVADLASGAGGLLEQLGDAVKMTIANPKVSVRNLGAAEKIEGFTTRRTLVETSHDLLINALGQKMTIRIATRNEVWSTDQLPGSLAEFLQMSGARTGIPAIDTILEAQQGKVTGFPLRQVTQVKIVQNGQETTSTSKVTLRDVVKRNVDPAVFNLPANLTKKASPLESLGR